jgi:hypothetical protein
VLEVVGQTNEEIRKLTQIVMQQQEVIKSLEKRLEETQHQLDEIKNNQAAATSVGTSPRRSYADVARTPPTSQPSNVHTLSSMNTTPSSFTDTLFCTIDTSRVEDMERDKTTAGYPWNKEPGELAMPCCDSGPKEGEPDQDRVSR